AESPGRRLRVQRQSKGLEIVRIASQLHLRPSLVEALEHDQYEKLPNSVFVAGYLRNYARLLGMDPEAIVSAYRAANPNVEPPPPRVVRTAKSEIGSSHILVRLVSLALIAGVIGMLALWWQNRADFISGPGGLNQGAGLALSPMEEETGGASNMIGSGPDSGSAAIEEPPTVAPVDAVAEPPTTLVEPEDIATLSAATVPSADESEPLSMTADDSAPSSAIATETAGAAAPGPSAALGEADVSAAEAPQAAPESPAVGEVALEFSGPCWIDVRDASGKAVLTGEMAKGDRRVLAGQPPYSFVIGNAGATRLTVAGKPFDLQSRSRGNVARFKLNPEAPE
ncbi:MAG: RodZ domain-containing protein, partial [Chromatiaceae bacterium]